MTTPERKTPQADAQDAEIRSEMARSKLLAARDRLVTSVARFRGTRDRAAVRRGAPRPPAA